jgi:HEAT repeat protein
VRGWARGEPFFDGCSASAWAERLGSRDPVVQADTPEKLEAGKAAAVRVLIHILSWPDASIRWKAAEILSRIGPEAHGAALALVGKLDDPDPFVRKVAAEALGKIKDARPEVLTAMVAKLSTDERDLVIGPLSRFGAAAEPATRALIAIVKNDSLGDRTRWEAIQTLGEIGPGARDAIPALIDALKDRDDDVREHAAESLGDIGAIEAVPQLTMALADESPEVRRDAVRSLGQLGPAAKPALAAIEKLLGDKNENVRGAAKSALRRIDPEGHSK